MIPQPSEPVKPRPAARDRGAWHANPYQRESALDLVKRLVRAGTPVDLTSSAVASILKSACKADKSTPLAELPTRFETRRALFEAILYRCAYRADEQAATPKALHALRALSVIAEVPHAISTAPKGFVRPTAANLERPHTPATQALLRWTGLDARQHGEGRALPEQTARQLWEACVKAAAWQRAVKAATQPDAQPISHELIDLMSIAEVLDAAETWRFSQPSPIQEVSDMSKAKQQNPFPLSDEDEEKITTPDGITVRAAAALRESTQALGADDEDTGDFDLPPEVADQITREIDEIDEEDAALQQRTQDEPLDPEPDDEETPRQFRERLGRILENAGVRDLRAAFKHATGYGTVDAAIGAGRSRQEIEAQIVAYAEVQKNAPPSTPKTQSHTETPKTQNERPAAPKSGQNAALLPMGDTPEGNRFALLVNQAQMFLKSGFLPPSIRNVEQVITLAAMGQQLGIAPIAAINGIDVIQGRPSIKPQLMLALIYKSGQLEDLQVSDDGTTCTVTVKRTGMTPHTEKFSMADAAAMGLTGKDNWRKQPAVMRKWRTIAAAARVVFPDVIWGFYTPDEMGSTDLIDE